MVEEATVPTATIYVSNGDQFPMTVGGVGDGGVGGHNRNGGSGVSGANGGYVTNSPNYEC